MARYTRLNIDDSEDSAPRFGLAPGLEARFGRRPLESEIVAVSGETPAPGFRVQFGHRHRDQEEIYVVLRGSGRIKIDDEILDLRQGDVVRLGRGVWRCTEGGPEGPAVSRGRRARLRRGRLGDRAGLVERLTS